MLRAIICYVIGCGSRCLLLFGFAVSLIVGWMSVIVSMLLYCRNALALHTCMNGDVHGAADVLCAMRAVSCCCSVLLWSR